MSHLFALCFAFLPAQGLAGLITKPHPVVELIKMNPQFRDAFRGRIQSLSGIGSLPANPAQGLPRPMPEDNPAELAALTDAAAMLLRDWPGINKADLRKALGPDGLHHLEGISFSEDHIRGMMSRLRGKSLEDPADFAQHLDTMFDNARNGAQGMLPKAQRRGVVISGSRMRLTGPQDRYPTCFDDIAPKQSSVLMKNYARNRRLRELLTYAGIAYLGVPAAIILDSKMALRILFETYPLRWVAANLNQNYLKPTFLEQFMRQSPDYSVVNNLWPVFASIAIAICAIALFDALFNRKSEEHDRNGIGVYGLFAVGGCVVGSAWFLLATCLPVASVALSMLIAGAGGLGLNGTRIFKFQDISKFIMDACFFGLASSVLLAAIAIGIDLYNLPRTSSMFIAHAFLLAAFFLFLVFKYVDHAAKVLSGIKTSRLLSPFVRFIGPLILCFALLPAQGSAALLKKPHPVVAVIAVNPHLSGAIAAHIDLVSCAGFQPAKSIRLSPAEGMPQPLPADYKPTVQRKSEVAILNDAVLSLLYNWHKGRIREADLRKVLKPHSLWQLERIKFTDGQVNYTGLRREENGAADPARFAQVLDAMFDNARGDLWEISKITGRTQAPRYVTSKIVSDKEALYKTIHPNVEVVHCMLTRNEARNHARKWKQLSAYIGIANLGTAAGIIVQTKMTLDTLFETYPLRGLAVKLNHDQSDSPTFIEQMIRPVIDYSVIVNLWPVFAFITFAIFSIYLFKNLSRKKLDRDWSISCMELAAAGSVCLVISVGLPLASVALSMLIAGVEGVYKAEFKTSKFDYIDDFIAIAVASGLLSSALLAALVIGINAYHLPYKFSMFIAHALLAAGFWLFYSVKYGHHVPKIASSLTGRITNFIKKISELFVVRQTVNGSAD